MRYRATIDLDVPDQTENPVESIAAIVGVAVGVLEEHDLRVTGLTVTEEGRP